MLGSGIIVGSVGVLVRPIAKGMNSSMSKMFAGTSGVARKAGEDASRAFAGPVETEGRSLPSRLLGPLRSSASEAGAAGASAGSSFMSSVVNGIYSAASSIASAFISVLKGGITIGGTAAIAGLGYTLTKGFGRLTSIENAEAKLKGLGHTAEGTSQIMENALTSVKGTAFGMDEAATTAASAVAAGVEPGKELESYLRQVGDAATIAGTDMTSMGSIFNKVMTSGKVQGDTFAQLSDQGIPIVQLLAEEMGITAEEVYKLGSEGKITSETFLAAMSSMDGAALEAGNTTVGALKNAGAAISRLGAALLAGVYPMIGQVARRFTELVDVVQAKVEPIIAALMERFGASATAGVDGFFDRLIGWVEAFDPQVVLTFVDRVTDFIGNLDFTSFQGFISSLTGLTGMQGGALEGVGGSLQMIAQASPGLLAGALDVLARALQFVSDHSETIVGLLPYLVAGFVAWKSATSLLAGAQQSSLALQTAMAPVQLANNIARNIAVQNERAFWLAKRASTTAEATGATTTNVATAATTRATLAERARTLATKVGTAITKLATLAVRGLGIAWKVAIGPIGWIIAGVALLGAALWAFFTKTETGRALWDKIWGGIKSAVAGVVDWFTGTLIPTFQQIWNIIAKGDFTGGGALEEDSGLVGVLFTIRETAMAAIDWFTGTLIPTFRQIWNIIAKGDFTGGGALEEDSGLVGVLFTIRETAMAVAAWFTGTFVPALQSAWQGIAAGAVWLWRNVLVPVWNGIKVAIALAIAVVMTIIDGLVWYWRNVVAPGAMWLWQNVLIPVWNGIKTAIAIAVAVVMTIIDGLVWYWQNVIAPVAMWLWNSVLVPVWNGIRAAIAVAVAVIMTIIDALVWYWRNVVAPGVTWLWQNVFVPVWNGIKAAIAAVVTWFQTVAWPLLSTVIGWIRARFEDFKLGLSVIWAFIRNNVINPVVAWFQGTVYPLFQRVLSFIKARFEDFKLGLSVIWAFIRNNVIYPVVAWFQGTVYPLFQRVLSFIRARFEDFKTGLKIIWDFIRNNVIQPVVTWFDTTIAPKIKTVTDRIKAAFDTMKDGIQKAWDGVKAAARAPVDFVINKVYNEGLKANFNNVAEKMGLPKSSRLPPMSLPAGFRRGGILPGQSRMQDGDDQLIAARRGEGILVSEALRSARDKALFLAANAAGRAGVPFSSWLTRTGTPGFKGGGIVDWLKGASGDTIDWIKDKGGFIADAITDPKGALTRLVNTLTDAIPGAGMVRDLAVAVPKKIVGELADKLVSSFASTGGGAATPVGPMPAGASRSLSYARRVASSFGLTMTSFRRGGARTAGSGLVSLHALGRAMDFSNSSGPTPQMMGFFNAMHPLRPTELLYSPAGGRQWRRSGRQADTSGATKRMHYNHVHVGFRNGGIFDGGPTLFDSGGILPPGLSTVLNASRRPEAVLTNEQMLQLQRLADGRAQTGPTFVNHVNATTDKARELVSELMWAQRTQVRRGRYQTAGGVA